MSLIRSGIPARRSLCTLLSQHPQFAPSKAVPQNGTSRLGSYPRQWSFRRNNATTATAVADADLPGSHRENIGNKRFRDFDLAGGVYVVTGGARGLGLCLAEALVEAGGKVHCLDLLPKPDASWATAQARILPEFGGSLHYHHVDVTNQKDLDETIASIAEDRQRLDGLIAGPTHDHSDADPYTPLTAAGKQLARPSITTSLAEANALMNINYTGVFMSASAAARQMLRYKTRGSICLIASMSGIVANKGLISPIYNSSKAAVIQLSKNLAMEWGKVREDGSGAIRVNCLSPGHILTPMVMDDFKRQPELKKIWERENMLGRLSKPEEFKAAGLFLLSRASSFMTGSNLVIDGGHTAW